MDRSATSVIGMPRDAIGEPGCGCRGDKRLRSRLRRRRSACRPPDDIALVPAAAGDQLGHGELAPGAE